MKYRGLGIPDPCLSAESAYTTYESASEVLVGSLLGVTDLNYVEYKYCVRRSSADTWKHREYLDTAGLIRRKELTDGTGLNRLRQATDNGAWLTAIPHCLNGTELPKE